MARRICAVEAAGGDEAGEDVDRGGNGAAGQRWRAEAEIQKSQPARAAALERMAHDKKSQPTRAAAGAGEGCGSDWRGLQQRPVGASPA
ncbi:hypothetical protein BHM03_00019071 [Ensete ventricosum]|nr:hypothetical protein BHM03_00019071 [Ensete ventricosum]